MHIDQEFEARLSGTRFPHVMDFQYLGEWFDELRIWRTSMHEFISWAKARLW